MRARGAHALIAPHATPCRASPRRQRGRALAGEKRLTSRSGPLGHVPNALPREPFSCALRVSNERQPADWPWRGHMKPQSLKSALRSMFSLIALLAACGGTEPGTAPRSRAAEREAPGSSSPNMIVAPNPTGEATTYSLAGAIDTNNLFFTTARQRKSKTPCTSMRRASGRFSPTTRRAIWSPSSARSEHGERGPGARTRS